MRHGQAQNVNTGTRKKTHFRIHRSLPFTDDPAVVDATFRDDAVMLLPNGGHIAGGKVI